MSIKGLIRGAWAFCSYLFWPQWGKNKKDGIIL